MLSFNRESKARELVRSELPQTSKQSHDSLVALHFVSTKRCLGSFALIRISTSPPLLLSSYEAISLF